MSLSAEEIQKSLEASMMSMQIQMENDHKILNEKIFNLEKLNMQKDEEIEKLKSNANNQLIADLNSEIRRREKEINEKIEEHKKDVEEIHNLNNQLSEKDEKIIQLEMDKKNLNNHFFFLQKKIDSFDEEKINTEKNIEEKDKIISEKDIKIEELNKEIKKMEENNKSMLLYIKEIKEKEELINKEKEELKNLQKKLEQEKIINNAQREEMKKIEKLKEEKENNKENSKSLEGKEELITDLLCEYLLKLNNSQYFISIFDLLNKSCKQFNELIFFNKLNSLSHESMNEILFNFFDSANSYFSIAKDKATLADFLSQKSFKFAQIEKDDIDIIKKITTIKLNKDINILDVYKKKKELFFKSKEFIFNLLKKKILTSQENDDIIENFGKPENESKEEKDIFLNITTPPLELEVNLDKLLKQDYSLVKYQVDNVFSKLRELTLKVSKFPIFLLYSLTVNCQNLNKLKIEFIKEKESPEINKKNIEIMNKICPKLISYLKEMTSFTLINLPFLMINLPDISASLKNSKIKKLSLINCFQSKDEINQLIPYFSLPNSLTEIDLSQHPNLSLPTELEKSLLNYNINKNLISVNFNNCGLNDDDIKCLTKYIVNSTSLIFCDIGKNILSNLSCSNFGYCILKSVSMETIILSECGINDEKLMFLFNGKGSKVLKHIYLNGNEFGDIGLISLCSFMKASPLLESIELEKCNGTDIGFKYIIDTIEENENNKIKYINYHKNKITNTSLDILKKFNEYFKKKKVVFALDKIFDGNENYEKIDCAIFT